MCLGVNLTNGSALVVNMGIWKEASMHSKNPATPSCNSLLNVIISIHCPVLDVGSETSHSRVS